MRSNRAYETRFGASRGTSNIQQLLIVQQTNTETETERENQKRTDSKLTL